MRFEQVRNATVIIDYAGKRFLVDPWLADKDSNGTFADLGMQRETVAAEHNTIAMPINDLPKPINEVLKGVDYYIITHIHPDHIDMLPDGRVGENLGHNVPTFVQSTEDAEVMKKSGFTDVRIMSENTVIGDIKLIKTPALHGTKIPCGPASGFILEHKNEKSIYIAGDTIWYAEVEKTLQKYQPDVIVLNACAATFNSFGRLIMNDDDVVNVYKTSPKAAIIASHMDNVAHATLSRITLKQKLQEYGISEHILIPEDGESYNL